MISILKRLYKFLYSIKLALYLFFIITVASIVGSVTTRTNLIAPPDDITPFEEIFKTYDLFSSWWFKTIMVLFSINLTLCIIHRFIPHLKKYFSKDLFNEKAVNSPWISDKIEPGDGADAAAILEKVKRFYKRKGYHIHETDKGIVAEKGRYSRLLPFMFHVSLLVILIGVIIGIFFGFTGTVNIHVNTETNEFYNWNELKDDKFDFTMRLDQFYLEYYPLPATVAVKDIRKLGKVELYDVKEREKFRINDSPYEVVILDVVLDKRFTESDFYFRLFKDGEFVGDFYDDQEIEDFPYDIYYPVLLRIGVRDKESNADISTHQIAVGESFNIHNTPYHVLVNGFGKLSEEEDFNFHFTLYKGEEKLGEFYGNDEVNMPGFSYRLGMLAYKFPFFPERIPKFMKAKLQILEHGVIEKEGVIEVNHPMTYKDMSFFETSFARDDFGFMYVGFQIVKDPGVSIVYTGFILMFIAVMPIFFISHKKIYITHDEDYIYLAGEATKNKKDFKEEFFEHAKELKGSCIQAV